VLMLEIKRVIPELKTALSWSENKVTGERKHLGYTP
jgi:hypothetical protein